VNDLVEKQKVFPKVVSKLSKLQGCQLETTSHEVKQKWAEFIAEFELFRQTAFSMQADAVLH